LPGAGAGRRGGPLIKPRSGAPTERGTGGALPEKASPLQFSGPGPARPFLASRCVPGPSGLRKDGPPVLLHFAEPFNGTRRRGPRSPMRQGTLRSRTVVGMSLRTPLPPAISTAFRGADGLPGPKGDGPRPRPWGTLRKPKAARNVIRRTRAEPTRETIVKRPPAGPVSSNSGKLEGEHSALRIPPPRSRKSQRIDAGSDCTCRRGCGSSSLSAEGRSLPGGVARRTSRAV